MTSFLSMLRDTLAELATLSRTRTLLVALLFMLPVAAFLCGLDVAHRYAGGDGQHMPWQFSLSEEEALGEWFEDLLLLIAAASMLRLWWRENAAIQAMVGAIFVWLAADNGLALHEQAGARLAPALAGIAGERAADLGEVIAFVLIGLAALGLIVAAARRSPREAVIGAAVPVLFLGFAAGFAVGVDFLDQLDWSPNFALALGFLEDGGELLMLVLACAFAVAMGRTRVGPAERGGRGASEAGPGPLEMQPGSC